MIWLVLGGLVGLIVGLLIYARWNFGTLEKMGIPVVKHHYILGSTKEVYSTVGGLNDVKWLKEYGPIFGVYEGRLPQVFICIPELVRLICVKDAEYFDSKRDLKLKDPVLNEMPDFLPTEKWRIVRSMTTPAFTSAKIKMMNLPMREATQDFVASLKKTINSSKNGVYEKLAIDSAIHTMLTDLIGRCVFSIKINDADNELAKTVKNLMQPPTARNIPQSLLLLSHTFPFLKAFIPDVILEAEPVQKFVELFKNMFNQRRKTGERHNDVVDLCMDWYDRLDEEQFKKAKVTELTVFCQAIVFFAAAQDQVSTMVAALIYHMTQDPVMEKRVYEEVDEVFAKHKGVINHESLHELVYLNACLQECLRMYTFFHRTERVCTKEWKNEKYNLHLKPGQLVILPIWAINRNPEYNENPNTFKPERFMPENKDKLDIYASTSFGHGPRNCTGKRFATEVMPIISAYILKELKFKKRADTELKFLPGGPIFQPHAEIFVDVMTRSD